MNTQNCIKINAPAKINLVLDVLNRRPDGYHNVKMVMQSLSLCDVVTVELKGEGITISSSSGAVPCDDTNIAYKAAKIMLKKANSNVGVHIDIQKNIPVAAGLAGGSTDGAAVLCALNTMLNLNLSENELMSLGATFGADVPYCVMQGTALAEGTGTELTKLPSYGNHTVLLVKPGIAVSTPWVYKNLNLKSVVHPDVDKFIQLIGNKEYTKSYEFMGNVLESVTIKEYPVISQIKNKMYALGASVSLMSGSGPTVFGIFENKQKALEAAKIFKNDFSEVIVTETV